MDNLTAILVTLIPFVLFCLIVFAILAVFAGAVIFFLKFFNKQWSAVNTGLQQPGKAYLAETAANLLPWTPEALADLSAYLDYVSRAGLGNLHARGTVKSLSRPDETGRLVFELQLKRLKGAMTLKSAQKCWQLKFLGLTSKETPVEADGEPLGTIQSIRKEILLLDPNGQTIGRYQRRQLLGGFGGLTEYAQTPYFGPVELNGRVLAELNRNPILLKPLVGNKIPPPLVKDPASDLTPEEETWLVALVGWEIMYRIVTK
ncbi:MAG: hypothetical protein D6768_10345 [Chloroflexi bacterium]|nr:MAG: hypothetical protein D6768_10345 [Chloroflexota bacterium]